MKTNNNNTMSRAWEIYRANSDNKIKAIFAICLKIAWEEYKIKQLNNINSPETIVSKWKSMSIIDQRNLVTSMYKTVCKNNIKSGMFSGNIDTAIKGANTYNQINDTWLWQRFGVSAEELENTCFVEVLKDINIDTIVLKNQKRNRKGESNIGFARLIYNACNRGLMSLYRAEIKHDKATNIQTIPDNNGNSIDIINLQADAKAFFTDKVDAKILVGQFAATLADKDIKIFAMLVEGQTERQIAKALELSKTAIHNRILKLRDNFKNFITA